MCYFHGMKLTQELWSRHIHTCRDGQLSQSVYCKKNNLKLSTFQYWNAKLKKNLKQGFVQIQPVMKRQSSGNYLNIGFSKDEGFQIRVNIQF